MIDIDSKKVNSIVLIALFILSIFTIYPVIKVAPVKANPTYITASSEYLGQYNYILIKVVDTGATSTPQIQIYQNTTFIGSGYLNKTLITGTYALFLAYNSTYGNSTLKWQGANILVVNMSVAGDKYGGPNGIANFTVVTPISLGQGDLTIKYVQRNEETTVHAKDSKVTLVGVDRETIPPGAVIYMNVSDPTANINVTKADFYNNTANIENYTVTLKHYSNVQTPLPDVTLNVSGLGVFKDGGTPVGMINETGIDTGVFTINISLASIGWDSWLNNTDTVRVVITDAQGGSITKDFNVSVQDASVSVDSTSLDFTTPVTITVSDFDRNNDSKTKESFFIYLNVSKSDITTPGVTWIPLNETGVNTGIFTGKLYLNITTDQDSQVANNVSTGGAVLIANFSMFRLPKYTQNWVIKATYNDTFYAHLSLASQNKNITLSPASPSVEWEQSQYSFTGTARAKLTLPTANDNTTVREVLNLTVGVNPVNNTGAGLNHTTPNVLLGNFSLYLWNSTGSSWYGPLYLNGSTASGPWNYSASITNMSAPYESGANTGVFYVSVNLTALNLTVIEPFKSGTKLNITYYDYYSNDTVKSASVTIGGVKKGTVELDRTEYPIVLSNVIVNVTVTDSDLNTDPGTAESYNYPNQKVYVWFINASDGVSKISPSTLGLSVNYINLTETGVNTGVFTGIYNLNYSAMSSSKLKWIIGGKIQVNYTEPLASGNFVIDTADLVAHDASLSTNVTTVNMGEGIRITLNEPDRNLNKYENDSVTIQYKVGTKATYYDITLDETNVNTGVFEANLTVGSGTLSHVSAGKTFVLNFTDYGTSLSHHSTGLANQSLTVTVTVPSHTATITLDKSEYGPYSKVYVNVTDPDSKLEDSLTIQVKSSKLTTPVSIDSWNRTDSTFRFNFTIYLDTNVSATDTLYIYYTDPADASGATTTISKTASVSCETASIEFDKSYYNVGDYMTVTITDLDRNKDSSVVESIYALINSTSYPQGNNVSLIETGNNTGIFSTRIYLKSTGVPSGTEMLVKAGDTVEVVYWDPHNETGKAQYVTNTTSIGRPAPTYPVPASTPGLLSSGFESITNTSVGTQVYINASFTNNGTTTQYTVAFVQVLDSEGHPIYFTYHIVPELAAGQSMSVLDAWTPSEAGTYTIKILITDKLVGGKALSEPIETTITVTE